MKQDNTIRDPVPDADAPHSEDEQRTTRTRLEIEFQELSGRVLALSERTERLPGEIRRLSASIGKGVAWLAVPLWVILVLLAAIAL